MYEQHIILDFEMNPIAARYRTPENYLEREIVEIGAVRLGKNAERVDNFQCYIKPAYNDTITYDIKKLTGITVTDVHKAISFADAVKAFADWVGYEKKTRVYSWSTSDLYQLWDECDWKAVAFPPNFRRWMDFQPIFPRLMEINTVGRLSLTMAAQWYGIEMDTKKAHDALYDAEITAELIAPFLTGEYKVQRDCLKKILNGGKI